MSERDDEIMQEIERHSMRQTERVRSMLYKHGRPDLVAEMDGKLREIRLGTYGAKATWRSLSDAQRFALEFAAETGGRLARIGKTYWTPGDTCKIYGIRLATIRNLVARDLMAVDGGAFDPEREFVITEHGRFVLKHGQNENGPDPAVRQDRGQG